jgi:alpha-1,6-mannosyltransferase
VALALAFGPDFRTHLATYFALFTAGSLVALVSARSLSGSGAGFLLFAGALLRVTLLLRPPDLSDDVKRYAWDARVAAAGVSPYAYAPSDPAVAGLAPEAAALPHADVRTVYPPVAQAAFRAAHVLGGRPLAFKAVFAAADLSIVALLSGMGGPNAGFAAALYALHPLPLTESAGQGHLDALGVALLLASLIFLARGDRARAGVAYALSVLTKYLSLAAALPLARRGRVRLLAAAAATGLALWALASRGGASPVGGLADYAQRWEFNSLAYPALVAALDAGGVPEAAKAWFLEVKARLGHPAWTRPLFPLFYAGFFARAALLFVLAAALLAVAWRVRDSETAAFASLAALLLCSPTLHPWYLLWVLPFAARAREPAFLYLSSAVALSYALLYPVAWLPAPAVYGLEYGPFAVLAARSLRRARA